MVLGLLALLDSWAFLPRSGSSLSPAIDCQSLRVLSSWRASVFLAGARPNIVIELLEDDRHVAATSRGTGGCVAPASAAIF